MEFRCAQSSEIYRSYGGFRQQSERCKDRVIRSKHHVLKYVTRNRASEIDEQKYFRAPRACGSPQLGFNFLRRSPALMLRRVWAPGSLKDAGLQFSNAALC